MHAKDAETWNPWNTKRERERELCSRKITFISVLKKIQMDCQARDGPTFIINTSTKR